MDKRSTADKVLQALEALKRGGKTITVCGLCGFSTASRMSYPASARIRRISASIFGGPGSRWASL